MKTDKNGQAFIFDAVDKVWLRRSPVDGRELLEADPTRFLVADPDPEGQVDEPKFVADSSTGVKRDEDAASRVFSEMTVKELQTLATKHGVAWTGQDRKVSLVQRLVSASVQPPGTDPAPATVSDDPDTDAEK